MIVTAGRQKHRRAMFFHSDAGRPSRFLTGIRMVEFESGLW
jgi:hypothetical protein